MRNEFKGPSKSLKILWEMRDLARDDKARKTAQSKIDEYFFGKNEKKKKKQKKKKIYVSENEWEY
jgi:hypothetical protein